MNCHQAQPDCRFHILKYAGIAIIQRSRRNNSITSCKRGFSISAQSDGIKTRIHRTTTFTDPWHTQGRRRAFLFAACPRDGYIRKALIICVGCRRALPCIKSRGCDIDTLRGSRRGEIVH